MDSPFLAVVWSTLNIWSTSELQSEIEFVTRMLVDKSYPLDLAQTDIRAKMA